MKRKCYSGLLMALLISCTAACGKGTDETMQKVVVEDIASETADTRETEQKQEESQMQEAEDTESVQGTESLNTIPETYACAITISINPQVTLYLDENNVTIGVRYDNEDAVDAYSELELVGSSLESSMEQLVDAAVEKEYLKEDGRVSIELTEIGDETAVTDDKVLVIAKQTTEAVLEEKECLCTLETAVAKEVTETYGIEKAPTICADCNGTGIFCPGDPDFGKSRGNGNGYAGCGGTGFAPCPDINCNNGTYTDPNCGGSGLETCHGCGGSGKDGDQECSHCNGSGTIKCEYCHGAGVYAHEEFCMGTGIIECITVDEHIVCATCGGTGYVE